MIAAWLATNAIGHTNALSMSVCPTSMGIWLSRAKVWATFPPFEGRC